MIADPRGFILSHTRLQSPPLVPELQLHLADEITPIWTMTEDALAAIGAPPPFWAFAWAGGQALARYILDHPETVRGKRVFDFATGGGIVAIAGTRAGGASIAASDIDPFAAAAVALNAEANGVKVTFVGDDLLDEEPPAVDLILAADISYEKPVARRVRGWLLKAHAKGATVLMGDPRRSYFDETGLTRLAEYAVPTSRELEDVEIKPTDVWRFSD